MLLTGGPAQVGQAPTVLVAPQGVFFDACKEEGLRQQEQCRLVKPLVGVEPTDQLPNKGKDWC